MTQREESDTDVRLIERVLFNPDVTEEDYVVMRAAMSRRDERRFRRCARFLTRLARKLEAAR